MGVLNPARRRIQSIKKILSERTSRRKEEKLEHYVRIFWKSELSDLVEEGKWEQIDEEIKDFLEKINNGQFGSNTEYHIKYVSVDPRKESPAIEVSIEEVKEMLFFKILEWERDRIEYRDTAIVKGDTSDHYMYSEDAVEHQDEPYFVIEEREGSYEVGGKSVSEDSRFITLSFAKEHYSKTENLLKSFNYVKKLGEDIGVPEEEIEAAKKFEVEMKERIDLIGKAISSLENNEQEKAKKAWKALYRIVQEEENEN